MNNSYSDLTKDQLNITIAKRKNTDVQDWAGDISLALDLLKEVCSPAKKSRNPRAIDIMVETKDDQLWFDLSNIFVQEDDGELTLLNGWSDKDSPAIWFEGADLPPLCCLAWLTATESDGTNKREKADYIPPAPEYSGLFKITAKNKVENLVERLNAGLHNLGYDVDEKALEAIVEDSLHSILFPR